MGIPCESSNDTGDTIIPSREKSKRELYVENAAGEILLDDVLSKFLGKLPER